MAEKYGLGIVGYGRFGRMHAQALSEIPEAQIAAVMVGSEQSGLLAKEELHVPVYYDYDEFLKVEGMDSIIIATPNSTHVELAIRAMNAGKNVYLEKPMATNLDDAAKIIEVHEKTNSVIQIGFENRYSSFWSTVKSILSKGEIGSTISGKIENWRFPMRSGSKGWKYDKERVGHQLLEEAIHYTDLANWLMGKRPLYVTSYADDPAFTIESGRLTNVWVLIVYEMGQRFLILDNLNGFGISLTMTVSGDGGTITGGFAADSDDSTGVNTYIKSRNKENKIDTTNVELKGQLSDLTASLRSFMNAVEQHEEAEITVYDGYNALAICIAALESIKMGGAQPVKWIHPVGQ